MSAAPLSRSGWEATLAIRRREPVEAPPAHFRMDLTLTPIWSRSMKEDRAYEMRAEEDGDS